MKHIEKITINNARRLGENIEIDFGTGATILLAPNGTGKTTIFESIELALTGNIKRNEYCPDAIIRNGLSEMDVRLDFAEGKYCQAKLAKGRACTLIGDHAELFEIENKSSLPFLFRLTHFLEQSGKEWLVDQDNKIAGNILSKLPLGRDLYNIISKKTSLLRAIGNTENIAYNILKEANKKLTEFEELIAKRDKIAIVTTLTPLKEIVIKLLPISKLVNYEEYNDDYTVTLINTYFERIRVLHKQENDRKKDLVIRLTVLKERTQLYTFNSELLKEKLTVIDENSKKISEASSAMDKTNKELQDKKSNLLSIRDEVKKLNSIKAMFETVEQKRVNLIATKAELEQNEKKSGELNKSYQATIENLKKIERLRDHHRLVNEEILKHKNYITQAEQKRQFQKQWENVIKMNQEIIDIKIPEFEKRKSEYTLSKLRFDNEVSEAEKTYLIKKNALESLNKTSGAIQDAVSSIRKNLAENQRNCPVCQADYEPDNLVKRIEASLENLNPFIPQAILEEKKALEVFQLAKGKQSEEYQKLQDIVSEINMVHEKLKENKKIILEKLLPLFPDCKNPEEANTQIEEDISQITAIISGLETNRSDLEPEVGIEEINCANVIKLEKERTIRELSFENGNLQKHILNDLENIRVLEDSLTGKEKETININLSAELNNEAEKTGSIQQLEATLSTIESVLKENQASYLSESEAISKIKGSQEGICTEWSQAGLEGQPNEEKLEITYDEVIKVINVLERYNANLNIIEQDLTNWRIAEKYNEANDEVRNQIGSAIEDAYIESLKTSIVQKSNIVKNIADKKCAINLFLSNVAIEYDQIHEQLNAINEPWKRLLKRIVINPLISKAPLLSNTTSRNMPIAKISATVHKQNIDIATIASEAQLSDLQLTLMLSMANKFKWTSWKALLLDDPTQHHDLVHASSVFDVLRDYIIDLDYQVMMSTHDSIQANFFQRKLQNEGVPSKIYQLVARKGGVTAERLT